MACIPKAEYRTIVNNAVHTMLGCGDNVGTMKHAADELYHVFRSITGVGFDDQNTPDIFLPSGKAISPEKAAHCLLEIKRTTIFIRGIYKAIGHCMAVANGKPVKILYVGTGPYATLIAPLLTLFTCEQMQVDLVEICKISFTSALKVIKELESASFVERVFLTDAAGLNLDKRYDIVVAEVMQAALKKEPQVAVMHNIVEQLGPSVIFIPEEVRLNATIVTSNEPSPRNNWNTNSHTINLGHIFTLDKFKTQPVLLKNSLKLPAKLKENNQLCINTTIRVFGDEKLKEGDCSLTLPVRVCTFKKSDYNEISFWYEAGRTPGVRCKLKDDERVFEALGRNNVFQPPTGFQKPDRGD